MRPGRRFGFGAAWRSVVAVLLLTASAFGQGWEADRVDPKGHSGAIVAVASSGKTLATAGSDGLAKVWDFGDGPLSHRVDLVGHDGPVLAVAVSTSGRVVATGGFDRTVRLWDAVEGKPLATLTGHSGPVEALAFAPDGKSVASGSLDTSIRLWDVETKQLIRDLRGHERGVRGLAFSPMGDLLASAARDKMVKLWDVAEGVERTTLGRHDAPAWCVAFAPDGLAVASGGLDRTVRLWRVVGAKPPTSARKSAVSTKRAVVQRQGRAADEKAVRVQVEPPPAPTPFNLPPQAAPLQSWTVEGDAVAVAFPLDGQSVAVAVSDLKASRTTPGSVVFLSDPSRPQPVPIPRATIRGHLGPILGLAFARDGQSVATVGGDGSVRAWSASLAIPQASSIGRPGPRDETVEGRIMNHLDPVEALAISPDGTRAATACGSTGVSLWDLASRTLVGRVRDPAGPSRAVAFSPDGQTLATGSDGKVVLLRDSAIGRPLEPLNGHLGAITCLAFSPDGKTLASGSKDASVTLWDVARRAEIATLARHTSAITALAYAPDGSMLATASLDDSVKLWELPSGRFLATLDAHKDVVDGLAFAPDGKTLATGDRTGTLRLWDVATRSVRHAIPASSSPIRGLAYSPDGQALVGVGDDRSIHRWDPVDGHPVARQLGAHDASILAVAFAPDGKTLVTAGLDRELKTWDLSRLAPGPFAGLEHKVRQLAISPDGKTLVTASSDQSLRFWDVATGRERTPAVFFQAADVRLAFSPDSRTVATMPVNFAFEGVKFWDVANGQMKFHGERHAEDAFAFAFTHDRKSWAINERGGVHLWELIPKGPAREFAEAESAVRSMAFSPDGQALAAGLLDGSLATWDARDPEKAPVVLSRPSLRAIGLLSYSPDGRSMAIAGEERVVRILDAATGAVRLTLRGPKKSITGLSYSPDGKLVASAADGEPSLFVWDSSSGEVVSNPSLSDASSGEGLACLAFSPDGKTLFAGGERGVTLFDMIEGHRPPPDLARVARKDQDRSTLRGHASGVEAVVFADEGSKLVSRSEDGVVKVWDLLDANRDRQTFGSNGFQAITMALRPDGKALAVALQLPANRLRANADRTEFKAALLRRPRGDGPVQRMADEVKVWDLETGQGVGLISGEATMRGVDRVGSLAYSPDGKTLATASRKGLDRIWEAPRFDVASTLDRRAQPADFVEFSKDGKTLVGADASGLVTLWDVETGKIRASFVHDGGLSQIAVSPDGKRLATSTGSGPASRVTVTVRSTDGVETTPGVAVSVGLGDPFGPGSGGDVRIWDLATGRRLAVLPTPSGQVGRLAFSGDGKMLAASSFEPVATVWDVESATPVVSVAWPWGRAKGLAFSPDGKALAVGGEDEALRVWDVPSGTLRAERSGHVDAINDLAFAPDGRTIATAGRDATVRLWDVPAPPPARD